jgi:transketolase C-terminal domain/subunit
MTRIGVKDTLSECGTNKELLEKFQMSSIFIEEAVKKVMKRKL